MQTVQSNDLIKQFGQTTADSEFLLYTEIATDLDLCSLIFNLLMLYCAVAFHLTLR